MGGIIRFIMRLFGRYQSGHEYWIRRNQIKINPEFRSNDIGKIKFKRKLRYWYNTGEFESNIILDRDYNLIDGYTSFRIAEIKEVDKVPVYFVD